MGNYVVGDNPNLIQRKELLGERIALEQKRYLELLSRQIDRFVAGKDVEGLRTLRGDMPAFLLEHPLAQRINEAIRDIEANFQADFNQTSKKSIIIFISSSIR